MSNKSARNKLNGHGRVICSECKKVIVTCKCPCCLVTQYDICDECESKNKYNKTIYPRIYIGVKSEKDGSLRSYIDNSVLEYNIDNPDLDNIHEAHENPSLPIALEVMTGEWIHSENYCEQTLIDMREALKWFMEREKN